MDKRRIIAGFATLAAAVLLAACADAPGEPGESPSPSPPATSPPVTPSPPMPAPTPSPGAEQTITGEVAEGVEMGCVVLRTDADVYLLLGDLVDDLQFTSTVTVRGYAEPDLMTTCQQGTPFHVQEVVSG